METRLKNAKKKNSDEKFAEMDPKGLVPYHICFLLPYAYIFNLKHSKAIKTVIYGMKSDFEPLSGIKVYLHAVYRATCGENRELRFAGIHLFVISGFFYSLHIYFS